MPGVSATSHGSSGMFRAGLGSLGTCCKTLNSISFITGLTALFASNFVFEKTLQPGYNAIFGTKHDINLVELTAEQIGLYVPKLLIGLTTSTIEGLATGSAKLIAPEGLSGNSNNPSPSPSPDNQWSTLRRSSPCILDKECVQGAPNERSSFIGFILPTAFLVGTLWICTYAYQRYLNVDVKKASESEQNTKKK